MPERSGRGRIASLTEAARMNGVAPFAYLKAAIEAIASRCFLDDARRHSRHVASTAAAIRVGGTVV